MQSITYSYARANLASTMSTAVENQEPILITRNKEEDCVLLSLSHYNSLQETAYLLRSPANAKRLIESVAQLQAGKGDAKTLIEE